MSTLAGKSEYVDITVTTEASVPSLVSNVRITSVKSSELSISWDAPVTEIGGDSDLVERYEGETKRDNRTWNTFRNVAKIKKKQLPFLIFYDTNCARQHRRDRLDLSLFEYSDRYRSTFASNDFRTGDADVFLFILVETKGSISAVSRKRSLVYLPRSKDRAKDSFSVRCYPRYDDATNATVIQTSELSATFKGLKPSTDYAIQVRAKTTRGWGEYTPVVFKKTPHAMGLGDYRRRIVAIVLSSIS